MLNIKIILLLFLLISCSEESNYIFDPETGSIFNNSINFSGDESTLDVITWNIENYPKNDFTNYYVKEIIDSLNIDFIALQEISNNEAFSNLSSLLGNHWYSFRSDSPSSEWGELAFLINQNEFEVIGTPYTILNSYQYEFAYRPPLVIACSYQNQSLVFINVHYKCCGDGILNDNYWDEENRRLQASYYLKNYIDTYLSNDKVIVLGDFNDDIAEYENNNNVFLNFINDTDNYYFADYQIATSSNQFWSYPSWPSHIDHILITNELISNVFETKTILIDNSLIGSFTTYNNYISDHRPVGIKLLFNP